MYNPYMVGKRVYLRHPTPEDVEGRWHEWLSDEETTLWLGSRYWPNCLENQRAFYESITKGKERMVLSVVDIETDRHIGVCNLSGINWLHRYTDMAVVIGEKEYRTGPYVLECVSMLLQIAFLRLNLRIVKGGYLACNESSKAILDVFRFREVGRYENLIWCNGAYTDNVMVMLHRDDWMRRNMKRIEG
ncbi:GNAT family N-acetyltransferase [Desulfohalovibrio reitneri]|uniref:GNAT family N-acetyltransferase n=1 Tax=Desulfohalovibrio reitneri TaxID=1307759 RepID=UPI0004A6E735|nr:GNAT family protein [Desulfohalovibrio reitneri]